MNQVCLHHKNYLVDGGDLFSPAETRELMNWLQGLTVDEAAIRSHCSPETVKTHRRALRDKTQQHQGIGVLTYCLVHGYIRPIDNGTPERKKRNKLMFSLRAAVANSFQGGQRHGAV